MVLLHSDKLWSSGLFYRMLPIFHVYRFFSTDHIEFRGDDSADTLSLAVRFLQTWSVVESLYISIKRPMVGETSSLG